MKHDDAMGIVPPDFILDRTLEQLTATRTTSDKSQLVTSLARRAKDKGLSDDYATKAAALYDAKIGPALDRQIDEAKALRAKSKHDAGVGRLPQGEGFYAAALRFNTTTSLTPDQIHKLGLDQGKEIAARIDGLLKKQGMTKGTVGERILALYAQEVYPNTDAARPTASPIATSASPISARICPACSSACRTTNSRCAACRWRRSRVPRPPSVRRRRSMVRGPASSISTCTTARNGRNGVCHDGVP